MRRMSNLKALSALLAIALLLVGCGNAGRPATNEEVREVVVGYVEANVVYAENETAAPEGTEEGIPEDESSAPAEAETPSEEDNPEVQETAVPEETVEPTAEPEETPAPFTEFEVSDAVWITANVNVRSGPGTDYEIIGTLDIGDCVTRIAITDNGWCKVTYEAVVGYVSGKYVSTDEYVPPTPAPVTQGSTDLCTGEAKVIFDEVNRVRAENGLDALIWSDELAAAASIRAEEIIERMEHTRPDGTKWYTVSSIASAENIIRGPHTDGIEMMQKWMDSEGHRTHILSPDLRIIGVATRCTDMGDTGCQLFGY